MARLFNGARMARAVGALGLVALTAGSLATPASAYLFWRSPQLQGAPVVGDEPGLLVPLEGATPKEVRANLLWGLRAGLNVAALQCQFAPALLTVSNYNALLKNHTAELADNYQTLMAYFKRKNPKGWQTALDQFSTRTYNGFSTFHGQLEFCETASSIGREALGQKRGELMTLAATRMRELRNSLSPAGDMVFALGTNSIVASPLPPIGCTDKKGRTIACRD
jgi:hypothetical protein